MNLFRNYRWWVKAVLVLLVAAGVGGMFIMPGRAQLLPPEEPVATEEDFDPDEVDFVVGTYDPQRVFMEYPGYDDLLESAEAAQQELEGADQQRGMEIQQEFSMKQNQIIQKFQQDINEHLPAVAESEGVQLVAIEVVYQADNVGVRDITPQLTEVLSEVDYEIPEAPDPAEMPALPPMQ